MYTGKNTQVSKRQCVSTIFEQKIGRVLSCAGEILLVFAHGTFFACSGKGLHVEIARICLVSSFRQPSLPIWQS